MTFEENIIKIEAKLERANHENNKKFFEDLVPPTKKHFWIFLVGFFLFHALVFFWSINLFSGFEAFSNSIPENMSEQKLVVYETFREFNNSSYFFISTMLYVFSCCSFFFSFLFKEKRQFTLTGCFSSFVFNFVFSFFCSILLYPTLNFFITTFDINLVLQFLTLGFVFSFGLGLFFSFKDVYTTVFLSEEEQVEFIKKEKEKSEIFAKNPEIKEELLDSINTMDDYLLLRFHCKSKGLKNTINLFQCIEDKLVSLSSFDTFSELELYHYESRTNKTYITND